MKVFYDCNHCEPESSGLINFLNKLPGSVEKIYLEGITDNYLPDMIKKYVNGDFGYNIAENPIIKEKYRLQKSFYTVINFARLKGLSIELIGQTEEEIKNSLKNFDDLSVLIIGNRHETLVAQVLT